MKTSQQSNSLKHALMFLSLFAMLFITSTESHGQSCKTKNRYRNGSWGVKGGFSFSNFYVNDIEDDSNLRKGFHAGIGGRIPVIGNVFAIQPEVLYSNKGITANYATSGGGQAVRHKFALNYLDIPVMASVKVLGMNIHAGVYGSYLLKGKVTAEEGANSSYTELRSADFRPFDFGYTGGVSFNLAGLGIGARYNYGLREVAKTELAQEALGDSKNSSLQLYVSMGIK
ncbi:MAG: porin family protein [Flammeovirgaceae bacterium]